MKAIFSPSSTVNGPTSKAVEPSPSFDFHPLSRVLFEVGALARLGELALSLGSRRPLLVTDPGLVAATNHPRRALAALRAAGLEAAEFDGVEENPTTAHVQAGAQAARMHGADLLIAVGGGSAMDVAKGINFLVSNGGQMADYKGFGRASQPMLPSIGVPTTAGTGSEAQSYALIADERTHLKMACGDRKAAFRIVVLDPELTVSQPEHVTAVTALDALTHAVESYVCSKRNPLSQSFAREAWRLLESNFETVLRHPDDLAARGSMQLGAYLAGCAIENSMLGAAHSCANPLTAHYGLTHGLAVALLLPHVMRFNAASVGSLYGDLAGEIGLPPREGQPAAETLAGRLTGFMHTAGLPTTLSACAVSPGIFPLLAEEASQQWTARFNPRAVSEEDLLGIYQAAL